MSVNDRSRSPKRWGSTPSHHTAKPRHKVASPTPAKVRAACSSAAATPAASAASSASVAVRQMVAPVGLGVNEAERHARLKLRQRVGNPRGALLHPQRRRPPRPAAVHHQRHMRGHQRGATAKQVAAQQRRVFKQPLRHMGMRAALELHMHHHGGFRRVAGAGLERRAPRHVLGADAVVVGDVLGRQPRQLVEVEVVHPGLAEQAQEVRRHARMGEQVLVRRVVVRGRAALLVR